jgi:molybdopterin-binding protein
MLKETVRKVIQGAVTSEVSITLAGGDEIMSIIKKKSVESLGLKEEKPSLSRRQCMMK